MFFIILHKAFIKLIDQHSDDWICLWQLKRNNVGRSLKTTMGAGQCGTLVWLTSTQKALDKLTRSLNPPAAELVDFSEVMPKIIKGDASVLEGPIEDLKLKLSTEDSNEQ